MRRLVLLRPKTLAAALVLLFMATSCGTPPGPLAPTAAVRPAETSSPTTAAPAATPRPTTAATQQATPVPEVATSIPELTPEQIATSAEQRATPAPASTALGTTAAQPDPAAFLQAQGKDLVYRDRKAVLKGINFDNVGALGASIGTGSMSDLTIDEQDYANLSANGANHVRFGVSYNWYADDREAYFRTLDQQVVWAREHSIWLIFNLFTTPGDCYEGYNNTCPFWDNPGEQQALLEFWVEMARHYNSEPAVAGYDLLNEPTPPDSCSQWFSIADRVRSAVAGVAPHQLIVISSCSDAVNALQEANLPRGANVVYQVHDYAPLDMSHDMFSPGSVYPGMAEDWFGTCYYDKSVFAGTIHADDPPVCEYAALRPRIGLDWADTNNVPLYIGEWGATSQLEGYVQFHQDKAELYRAWGVNHAAYTWKHQTIKTGGFYQWGIYSEPHNLDDPERLAAVKIAWEGAVKPDFTR